MACDPGVSFYEICLFSEGRHNGEVCANNSFRQALTVPIYVLGGLTYLACSWYSDRTQQRSHFAMASITLCILGYILLIANINPEASFAGCFFVAMGLYTEAGTPFSWDPVKKPRYGKHAIAIGIQLTIGNASGVAAPFLLSTGDLPRFVPGYAGKFCGCKLLSDFPVQISHLGTFATLAYTLAFLLLHALLIQVEQQEEAKG